MREDGQVDSIQRNLVHVVMQMHVCHGKRTLFVLGVVGLFVLDVVGLFVLGVVGSCWCSNHNQRSVYSYTHIKHIILYA